MNISVSPIVLFLLTVSHLLDSTVDAYNILGIFLFPAKSHYAVIEPIVTELANRGHRVTEYSPFVRSSSSNSTKNFVHVDVSRCFRMPGRQLTVDYLLSVSDGTYRAMSALLDFVPDYRTIVECPPMMELLSNRTAVRSFDLILTEVFNSEISLIFPYKLNVPFVQIVINTMFFWRVARLTGTPNWPSYAPLTSEPYDNLRMSGFFERLRNTLATCVADVMYDRLSTTRSDDAAKKLLGVDTPSVKEIAKNTSLTLIFIHNSLNDVRPLVPRVVQISGVQVKTANPLPGDIEKFINESEHGVVYFCMGSLLKGSSFPEDKRNAFLYAFSKIPQRVLWKWEGDVLPGKSNNIMTAKWMPQRDILAHPKVKLFISHGGLLGTNEAVYEGVPILGIPIFGDQRTNVKSIEASGAGEMLDYNEISKEIVLEKVQRLLNDPKYHENAKELSRRYRDRPMSPLDTAVYWTEYVIRHKGAHHLRSAAVDMAWYQYLLLDVIAFVIFVLVISLVIVYYSLKLTLRFVLNKFIKKQTGVGNDKKVKSN